MTSRKAAAIGTERSEACSDFGCSAGVGVDPICASRDVEETPLVGSGEFEHPLNTPDMVIIKRDRNSLVVLRSDIPGVLFHLNALCQVNLSAGSETWSEFDGSIYFDLQGMIKTTDGFQLP